MSCGNNELREPPLGVHTHQADIPAKSAKTEEDKPALQQERRAPVHSLGCFQTSFVGAAKSRTNLLRNLLLLCLKGTWWLSCLSLIPQTWEAILFKTEFTQTLGWSLWMTSINASIQAPRDLFAFTSTGKQSFWQNMCFYAFGFLTLLTIRRCAMSIFWVLH